MLAHFIPRKGKGPLVIVLPLLIAVILFITFDALNLSDKYIGAVSLLISSIFIWIFDGGPAVIREGLRNTPKSNHTLFWIEIKYWALLLGITGSIWMGILYGAK
jgi:hypothetical protein